MYVHELIEQLENLKCHCEEFAKDEVEEDIQPFTDDVIALTVAINIIDFFSKSGIPDYLLKGDIK